MADWIENVRNRLQSYGGGAATNVDRAVNQAVAPARPQPVPTRPTSTRNDIMNSIFSPEAYAQDARARAQGYASGGSIESNAPAYSPEDIQNALSQGLISEDDALYLMQSLEPQGSGLATALGAAAGGLGLGAAGAKLAQKGGLLQGAMGKAEALKGATDWMGRKVPDINLVPPVAEIDLLGKGVKGITDRSQGAMAGAASMGALGALGGGMTGNALTQEPGQGVGTENPTDAALRVLVDPNAPKQLKQQAVMFLQQASQAEGQEGGGESELLNLLAGGVGAAALGGAGYGLGRMGAKALNARAPAAQGSGAIDDALLGMAKDRPIPMMEGRNFNPLSTMSAGAMGAAGGAGSYAGVDALQERYGSPF